MAQLPSLSFSMSMIDITFSLPLLQFQSMSHPAATHQKINQKHCKPISFLEGATKQDAPRQTTRKGFKELYINNLFARRQ